MLLALLTAAFMAAFLSQAAPADAAPRAANAAECQILADVAVTARALAVSGVPEAQAHVAAAHMWDTRSDRAADLIRLIVATAYRSRESVSEYGYRVGLTCIKEQGDMDTVQGKDA